jgi:hypothetical protein
VVVNQYYDIDGTLRHGFFCSNCGQHTSWDATDHDPVIFHAFSKIKYWSRTVIPEPSCKQNPKRVEKLMRANPLHGKPKFERYAEVIAL